MADGTQINPGLGGDTIYDEDLGGGLKMPASKIHVGAHGVDGGAVTRSNPFPVGIGDIHGNIVDVSQDHTLNVSSRFRLVGSAFGTVAQGLDTVYWTPTVSGTGAAVSIVTDGIVTLASTTAGTGFGRLTTQRLARTVLTAANLYHSQIRIPTVVVAGSQRKWGAFVDGSPPAVQDGFAFELSATGVLSLSCYNGGVATYSVSSGAFNGEVAAFVIDTNVHHYDIEYTSTGVEFFVDDVMLHRFTPSLTMLASTFNLYADHFAYGTGTQATMELWGACIVRKGVETSQPRWAHYAGVVAGTQLKIGAGILRRLVVNSMAASTVISVYDATSATNPIAIIAPPSGGTPFTMEYLADFYTGLFLVVAGGSTDITIFYE